MKQIKDIERLDKILANNGFGTRKEVRHYIRSRIVTVNDVVASDPDMHVNINTDKIAINGTPIEIKSQVYYMMNKAAGYVCSTRGGIHPIVFDLLKGDEHRKYLGGDLNMVGRLDVDTEGLLIFTSDGDLNHRLTSPHYNVPKTYLVYLRDEVSIQQQEEYRTKLAAGLYIPPEGDESGAVCLPAEIQWKNREEYSFAAATEKPSAVCELTVYEGKYHEVKRLFAALGNEVVYLKRLSINKLYLDKSLKVGEYRELSEDELKLLDIQGQKNSSESDQ